ncbi:MAG: guanylate kinase [Ignavibacteria bacterium]|jgi:guanylate kinase
MKNLIVLSAPSGAGKTTVARHLLKQFPQCAFSVSATTRPMRAGEEHGKDYFFLSREEFLLNLENGNLVEHEEIFGNFYGTLRSQTDKRIQEQGLILFDVDVKGAVSLRNAYPKESLLIYIAPPDLSILADRLRSRMTESEEQIKQRLSRAAMEMEYMRHFDYIIINDTLEVTLGKAVSIVQEALSEM